MPQPENTPEPEERFVFKLHIIHPTEAPHLCWTIWKHPEQLNQKKSAHLEEVLAVAAPRAQELAEQLMDDETLVYPFATRLYKNPGAVFVPTARAQVVQHQGA